MKPTLQGKRLERYKTLLAEVWQVIHDQPWDEHAYAAYHRLGKEMGELVEERRHGKLDEAATEINEKVAMGLQAVLYQKLLADHEAKT